MNSSAIADITELLVPLDMRQASVRSVPVAGRVADRLGIGVRLFTASGEESEAETWLRGIAERHLGAHDVAVDVGPEGDPVEAIISAAEPGSMICMATAGSLRPHEGHVGSVAEGVVRHIGRPVMLIGPEMVPAPGEHTKRVIVPVDGSKFSELSVDVAGQLAGAFRVPVWVVTVISPETEASAEAQLRDGPLVESGYVARLAKQLGEKYGVDAEFEVLHWPDPARAIVDFVGDDGNVVMATHGRSGLNRLFAGSVATGVVARSQRAVVVWRPDGDKGS